jgi:hypothetical protein
VAWPSQHKEGDAGCEFKKRPGHKFAATICDLPGEDQYFSVSDEKYYRDYQWGIAQGIT